MYPLVRALAVPKLGGKLPPRTAKLAVPPGSDCAVPAQNPMPLDSVRIRTRSWFEVM